MQKMEKEISLSDKIVSVNRSMNDFIQTKHVKEFIKDETELLRLYDLGKISYLEFLF